MEIIVLQNITSKIIDITNNSVKISEKRRKYSIVGKYCQYHLFTNDKQINIYLV